MPKPMRQFPAIASLGILLALLVVSGDDKGIFVMHGNGSDVTRLMGPEFAGEGCGDVLNIPVDPMMMMMITLAEVEKNLSPPSAS